MDKKDIQLFNITIHQAKELITKIVKQKAELDEDVKLLQKMLDELYELFSDLTNKEGK